MCGRFNVTADPLAQLLMEMLGTSVAVEDQYNIAPTQVVQVVAMNEGTPTLQQMQWWLVPYWSKEAKTRYTTFNARSEKLEDSRVFAQPFARRRCVVPVSSFYEWRREGKNRLPLMMQRMDGDGLMFAGIWDSWRSGDEVLNSFAIVTTAAHDEMQQVHNRQPVMLDRTNWMQWLDTQTDRDVLAALMQPAIPYPLTITPVSTYVNNARNKGIQCIEPIGASLLIGEGNANKDDETGEKPTEH